MALFPLHRSCEQFVEKACFEPCAFGRQRSPCGKKVSPPLDFGLQTRGRRFVYVRVDLSVLCLIARVGLSVHIQTMTFSFVYELKGFIITLCLIARVDP